MTHGGTSRSWPISVWNKVFINTPRAYIISRKLSTQLLSTYKYQRSDIKNVYLVTFLLVSLWIVKFCKIHFAWIVFWFALTIMKIHFMSTDLLQCYHWFPSLIPTQALTDGAVRGFDLWPLRLKNYRDTSDTLELKNVCLCIQKLPTEKLFHLHYMVHEFLPCQLAAVIFRTESTNLPVRVLKSHSEWQIDICFHTLNIS